MLLELLTLASLLITSKSQCTEFEPGGTYAGYCCLYGGDTNNAGILGAQEVCLQKGSIKIPEEMTNCGPCCDVKVQYPECTSPSTCRLLNDLGYCSATDPSCDASLSTGYDCDHAGTTACSTGKECAQTGIGGFTSCGNCEETCAAMFPTTCNAQLTCSTGYCASTTGYLQDTTECVYDTCQACPINDCRTKSVNSKCNTDAGLCVADTTKDGCLICECTECGDGTGCAQTGYMCDVTTGCGTCIETCAVFPTTCDTHNNPCTTAGEYCASTIDHLQNQTPCPHDECQTCPANDDCMDKKVDDQCNNGLGACVDVYGKAGCLRCDECAVGWDNECSDPNAPSNVCTDGESYCVVDWTDGTNNGCKKNKCVACTQNDCYGGARNDACGTAAGTCQLESQNTMCLYCDEPSTTCPITPCDDGNGNVLPPDAPCDIPGTNILGECKMDVTQCTDCIDPCDHIISQYNTCAQDAECGDKICADFRDVYTGANIQKDCAYKRCKANPCDDSIYYPQCEPGTSPVCIGTDFDVCNTHTATFDAGTADPPATNLRYCGQCECSQCILDAGNCETGKYCAWSNNYGAACGYCATCECTSAGVSCNNGAGICAADSGKCGFMCKSLCDNYCSEHDKPRDYACSNNAGTGTCQFDDSLGCKTCNRDPCSQVAFDDQCDTTLNDCDIGDCVSTVDSVTQCQYNACDQPPQCPINLCYDGTNSVPGGQSCTLEHGLLGTCELYGNTNCLDCQRNRCLDCEGKERDADCNMDDGTPGTCQWSPDKQCKVCNKDLCRQTAYDSECAGGCTPPEECTPKNIDNCQKEVCQDPCAGYGTTCVDDAYCSVGQTCQSMNNDVPCQWNECAGCINECDANTSCDDHQSCSVAEYYGCNTCEDCDECDTTDQSTCLKDIYKDDNFVQGTCETQQDVCNRCEFVVACTDECNLDGSGTPCSTGTLCTAGTEVGLCTTCDDCVSWCVEGTNCHEDFNNDGIDETGICQKTTTTGCNECVCVNECEMDGSKLCNEGYQCAQSTFGCNECVYCNECEDAGKCTDNMYGRCEPNNDKCNVCVYGCEDECKTDGTMDCELGKICAVPDINSVDECNACEDCVDCVFGSGDACKLDEDGDNVIDKIGECIKDDVTGCTECVYECDGCTSNDESGDGICESGDDTSISINRQYCDLSNDVSCGVCVDCECTVDDDCNKDITSIGYVRECQIFDFRGRCGICVKKCDSGCVLGDADNRCTNNNNNQVCLDTTGINGDCGTCQDEQCSGDECSEDRKCIDANNSDNWECVIEESDTCGICDEKCTNECDITASTGCGSGQECEENKRGCGECVEPDEYCEDDDTPPHIKGHSIWKLIAGLIDGNLDDVVCEMCFCHNGNVNRLKMCYNRFKIRELVTEDWVEELFNKYCDKDTYPDLGWTDTSNTASTTEIQQCPLENVRIKPEALLDIKDVCSCKSLYCDINKEWSARQCQDVITDTTCEDRGSGETCDVTMCDQYKKVMTSQDLNCKGLCVGGDGTDGVHDGNSVNTFNVMIGFSVVMVVFGWM